jgi:hypothetical protein
MACARDDAALVGANEVARVTVLDRRRPQATGVTKQSNRGDLNLWLYSQPLLNFFQQRVPSRGAVPVPVGVDYDLYEVRVVETLSGALECGIVEV